MRLKGLIKDSFINSLCLRTNNWVIDLCVGDIITVDHFGKIVETNVQKINFDSTVSTPIGNFKIVDIINLTKL